MVFLNLQEVLDKVIHYLHFCLFWDPRCLSRLLIQAEDSGSIHGLKVARDAPPITHLLFVNDLMIFSRANRREVETINLILSKYS